MKIWLKGPDPGKQCCGCEGKAGPCGTCCPVQVVPKNQNPVTAGILKNSILADLRGGVSNTVATLTLKDSKITINNSSNVPFASAPCSLGGTTDNQGTYNLLMSVRSGDILEFTTEILSPSQSSTGPSYYQGVTLQIDCTPLPDVFPQSYNANFRRVTANGFVNMVAENTTGSRKTPATTQIFQPVISGSLISQSMYNTSITPQYCFIQGDCVTVLCGSIAPPAEGLSNAYYYKTNAAESNGNFSPQNIGVNSIASIYERAYRNTIEGYGIDCPSYPEATFSSDAPVGIGGRSTFRFRINGILRNEWIGTVGLGSPVSSKSFPTACVRIVMTNRSSIQLLDTGMAPQSILPRLRAFKLAPPPTIPP